MLRRASTFALTGLAAAVVMAASLTTPAGAAAQESAGAYRVGLVLQAGAAPGPGTASEPGEYGSRVEGWGFELMLEGPYGLRLFGGVEDVWFWAPVTICTLECGPGSMGYGGRVRSVGAGWQHPGARLAPYVGARGGTFRRDPGGSQVDLGLVGDLHAGLEFRLLSWLAPRAELRRHTHTPLVIAAGLRVSVPVPSRR